MENKQIQGLDVNGTKPTVAVPNQLSDLNDGNTVLTKSNSSNKVYATDNSGNQTTITYSQGINDGASIVQRDANGRITTQDPTSNTDATNKLYVDTLFDGSQKALAYADYDTMITAFNDFADDDYKVGQNVYIRTLNVPDLWVYSVESTSVPYTYVDDATFIAGLTQDGYVQVGYYKLAQLETQTASINNVTAGDIDSESATSGQLLTADGSGGANWQSPSSPHLYCHTVWLGSNSGDVGAIFNLITTSSTPYASMSDVASALSSLGFSSTNRFNIQSQYLTSTSTGVNFSQYSSIYPSGTNVYAWGKTRLLSIDGNNILTIASGGANSGKNIDLFVSDTVYQII